MRIARMSTDTRIDWVATDADGQVLGRAADDGFSPLPTLPDDLAPTGERLPAGAHRLVPCRPRKIVAIGLNYRDHVAEAGMTAPERPIVFAKFPSSLIGPDDPIVLDLELSERADWETELGVIVGRHMRNVSQDRALDHVYGYVAANDVSARDLQFGDGQWTRGKSLDTYCPVGPEIVTADEVPDPQQIALRTRVNDETVQDSSTAEMIFGVAEILAFCSRSFTLEPGDLVLTGTPWGCGEFMDPRRSLQPGDMLETQVEGIGTLRNPVMAAR